MTEQLTPERAVRLLRAKGAELEAVVLAALDGPENINPLEAGLMELTADIALVAQLLADHIERSERHDEQLRQYLAARTTEVDWEAFDKWLDLPRPEGDSPT